MSKNGLILAISCGLPNTKVFPEAVPSVLVLLSSSPIPIIILWPTDKFLLLFQAFAQVWALSVHFTWGLGLSQSSMCFVNIPLLHEVRVPSRKEKAHSRNVRTHSRNEGELKEGTIFKMWSEWRETRRNGEATGASDVKEPLHTPRPVEERGGRGMALTLWEPQRSPGETHV